MTLRRRIDRLEAATQPAPAGFWWPPMIEQRPGQNIDAEVAKIRADAEAAGWAPGGGILCIVAELAEGDLEGEDR